MLVALHESLAPSTRAFCAMVRPPHAQHPGEIHQFCCAPVAPGIVFEPFALGGGPPNVVSSSKELDPPILGRIRAARAAAWSRVQPPTQTPPIRGGLLRSEPPIGRFFRGGLRGCLMETPPLLRSFHQTLRWRLQWTLLSTPCNRSFHKKNSPFSRLGSLDGNPNTSEKYKTTENSLPAAKPERFWDSPLRLLQASQVHCRLHHHRVHGP